MKMNPTDLFDASSLTTNKLKRLEDEYRRLYARAKRIADTNHLLIYYIQQGRITDTDDIDAAEAWLNHSDLEPEDILAKVLGED
jgi:hypothetical protein